MGISVESRIHRTLRKLERYRACSRWEDLPQLENTDSPLGENEKLLGVYENVPGRSHNLLLFTSLAVHLWNGVTWRNLRYADIAGTEWPTEAKNEAHILVVRMKNGAPERVPILGGTKLTRDLFTVMTFLDRVIQDVA